jgi:signal transduction histidine kinase
MQKRIIFSVFLSLIIILLSWGVISYISVNQSIENSIEKRLELAQIVSSYIDYVIEDSLKRLYDISTSYNIDFKDNNWEIEKKALKTVYQYSIFTDGVFLLDIYGNVVMSYPSRQPPKLNLLSIPYISRIITEKRPIVSDLYTIESLNKKLIYLLVPLKDSSGEVIGIAGGMIDPTSYALSNLLSSIRSGTNTCIELVDSNGIIISSNKPSRILTLSDHNRFLSNLIINRKTSVGMCHRCHLERGEGKTSDIMAFAPLTKASWGVLIREPQEIVLAPASRLKKGFLLLGLVSVGTALMLAVGITRSIVKPIQLLINATGRIAEGHLSESVRISSSDEIGILARSFEHMRLKLAESLEEIKRQNIELERRVIERTKQLRESQQKIATLLKQVISTQEEERKRIARELHDETMQDISAFLMKLEMFKMYPENMNEEKIKEMKKIIVRILEDIRNIIQNLRPSILDDLGLEAAIRWLLERHLGEKGISYFLTIKGDKDRRFDPQVEITLFRIIQEAITNIARHSKAKNVYVLLKADTDSIQVDIEDDGIGFDVESIMTHLSEDGRGLGILGMKERASLFDGYLTICSKPGIGTRVTLKFPIKSEGTRYVQN